ncbi:S41 family peptidase [Nitrospina gracilis]|uniref:S41 family peptidase n=1 Tax=Nitrospina gracilis TaxID=35801 RepID=UPI001F4410B2|nr:S41 family peptidase [Nitrospina gracilis]MCF8721186.1 C-terminal peptidase prc [Nitrospina gracilis Nb-211]
MTTGKRTGIGRWLGVLGALALSLALIAPWHATPVPSSLPTSAHAGFFDDDLEIFEEVLDLVSGNYVYPPDYKTLFETSIQGMIAKVPEKTLTVTDVYSGQVLKKDSARLSYRLSFSRHENMEAFRSVYYFLANQYQGQLKKKDIEQAAIIGLMSSLDPYSLYMDKDDFERSMRDTEGQYGGVGMVITMEDLKLTVVRTLKNSPAERAGILPKDVISQVDGQTVKGMQINELAERLRGYPNTKVQIQVFRPSTNSTQEITLTREIISIETVEYKNMGDGVGYLSINSFSKQTNDQLQVALNQALEEGVTAFIMDLRNNPGGLLSQSVKVASHFLNKGELIVYTRGRDRNDMQTYQALYKNTLTHLPLVVLINKQSASASEIVAGSLKDSGKALILGETSYGKGSVQTIFRMSDGSGLRLTTSKYYTPSGIDINQHGITPEIIVEKDLPQGTEGEAPREPKGAKKDPAPLARNLATRLKETELIDYLKQKGYTNTDSIDPLVEFAKLVVRDSQHPSKSHALAKARELAKDIHY